jgi:hypothetical protein
MARVAVDEGLLDGGLLRRVDLERRHEIAVQAREARGERRAGVGADGSAGDEGEPRPGAVDHAPAGAAETGIDADDANHVCQGKAPSTAMPPPAITRRGRFQRARKVF